MASDNNKETVKRFYTTVQRGDIDQALELLTEDVDWNMPGSAPYAGRRTGRDAVRQFFVDMNRVQQVDELDARRFVAEGDIVVALGYERATVRDTGRHFEQEFAHEFRLREGRIAEIHLYEDTHAQAAAFGENNREREALLGPMGVTHPAYSGGPNREY